MGDMGPCLYGKGRFSSSHPWSDIRVPLIILQVPETLRKEKFYTFCDELYLQQSCDTVPLNVLQVPALRNVKFYTCCDELYLEQSCDNVPCLQVPALRNVKFYTCCDELYLEQSCDNVPLILLAGSSSEKCEVLHVL